MEGQIFDVVQVQFHANNICAKGGGDRNRENEYSQYSLRCSFLFHDWLKSGYKMELQLIRVNPSRSEFIISM